MENIILKERNEIIKYQLFHNIPNETIIRKILIIFNLEDLNENYYFTFMDLEKNMVINKLIKIRPELNKFYMLCKQKRFLENITIKKSITILRHFLKIIDYKLIAREKYGDGKKYLQYHVKRHNYKKELKNFIVKFD